MAERPAAPVRIAAIGCGFFARNHLMAWHDMAETELVGICDLDEERARRAAALCGEPPVFIDAERMLAETRPDAVDIITTMETHERLVELCARHRLPVICQKPFAPDLATVRRIVTRTDEAGIPLMVHENFRFQSPMIALRRLLDDQAIGRPVSAWLSWRTGFEVFEGQPYLVTVERLILLDLVIHVFDLARYLFGDAERLLARTQQVTPGIRGEDGATCLVEHVGGTVALIACSYHTQVSPDPFPETVLRIEGTAGRLELGRGFDLTITTAAGTARRNLAPPPPHWGDPTWAMVQESVLNTQRHFVEALRTGQEPATSGHDNARTFAMVEAAYRSAARDGWVNLADV
jgi:predicted dehydrogenase